MTYEFAIVTRDEVWSDRTLVESRLAHGISVTRGREIVASDDCDERLLAEADEELALARRALVGIPKGRVRMIVSARRGSRSSTLTINHAGLSVVTTPEYAARDYETLRNLSSQSPLPLAGEGGRRPGEGPHPPSGHLLPQAGEGPGVPTLWRNGSGSVLLHEAIGHAAEHQHFSTWPEWLSVRDEPDTRFDDTGAPTTSADLVTEAPRCYRRQTFTDVPLRRMTSVIVRQDGAPFELPPRRIEIDLLAGGRYEPLTGTITLHVTASRLIDGSSNQALAPFVITETRDAVARGLIGAGGEVERYPGLVCSREGQEVIVGSYAPLLLTRF